jgi:hypothetical protein
MSFADFIMSRRLNKRSGMRTDFIEDSRWLIKQGRFPDFKHVEALEGWMIVGGACWEAVREGKRLFRQYQRQRP